MTKSIRTAALILAVALPSYAFSQEVALGIGYTDFPDRGTDTVTTGLDYRHSPFYERSRFSAAIAANLSITEESDAFAGAGVGLRWEWRSNWFADVSLLAGYYEQGDPGNDLGHDLQFRSLLAVGYRFDSGNAVSLGITHKSNASISNLNPGADSILLRWHLPLGS